MSINILYQFLFVFIILVFILYLVLFYSNIFSLKYLQYIHGNILAMFLWSSVIIIAYFGGLQTVSIMLAVLFTLGSIVYRIEYAKVHFIENKKESLPLSEETLSETSSETSSIESDVDHEKESGESKETFIDMSLDLSKTLDPIQGNFKDVLGYSDHPFSKYFQDML